MHGRFSFTRVPVVGAVGIVVSTTVTKNQAAPLCAQLIRRALLYLRKIYYESYVRAHVVD